MKITLINAEQIININTIICAKEKQTSICLDHRKVESAVAAAYYPGFYPFQYGGIASVAGALCFFLIKAHAFLDGNKRTAAIAATTLLALNNLIILYPIDKDNNINSFAKVLEGCACSEISKEELMQWYDTHKQALKA
ncbi:type II toxin-antitoxin system death-on-curing family toxin [soil metagenome]